MLLDLERGTKKTKKKKKMSKKKNIVPFKLAVPIKDNKRSKKNKKQQDKDPNAEEKIKKVLGISNNEVSIEWPPKNSSEHQETDKMADEQNTNAREVEEIEDEESTSLPSGIKNLEPINLTIDLNWNRQIHEQNNEVKEGTDNIKNKERTKDSNINRNNSTTNKITGKNSSSPQKSIGKERADVDQNDNENQKKLQEGLDTKDINNKKKCDKKQQQETNNSDPNPPNSKEGDFFQISEEDVLSTLRGRSRIKRHDKSKKKQEHLSFQR
ncbi:hypothetical protein HAX54_006620 [Datura stramonium]|uniref:Uncharacterized protein n=1 Tax=Datura stramonium TaxID=4076 RepID=A0ABS8TBS1_DATST|nr:hypothetical protein [Datura stramonium]